jgi:electron transport complex, RnfABCDGE type, E subunit
MAETKKKSKLSILTNGIIKENPALVLVLGTCPTLATTSSVANGFGMGVSAAAVLICSNIVISALRNVIPDKVRIPCYIVVIAGFVTVVQLLLQAFVPSLYSALGLFIPLIVVNCIILGRAEMFANKNSVIDSALDGVGMGIGFTFALVCMGTVRELLGSGTWLGIPILSKFIPGMGIFNLAPGGFFVFAILMAFVTYLTKDKSKIKKDFGCAGCAMASVCTGEEDRKGAEEAC